MKYLKLLFLSLGVMTLLIFISLQFPSVKKGIYKTLFKVTVNNSMSVWEDNSFLKATVCGSGTPLRTKNVAQSCIMVEAGNDLYIVDVGDGSVANIQRWGINLSNLKAALITHLHSDHIADLPDLNLISWVNRSREQNLTIFGPEGIETVIEGFNQAYSLDHKFRNEHHGDEQAPLGVNEMVANIIEGEGIILSDNGLRITAFLVEHDPVTPAYGYRFDYKGRSIVISGDTAYSTNLINYAKDVDLLFHEAISYEMMDINTEAMTSFYETTNNDFYRFGADLFQHIEDYHTPFEEVAIVAKQSNAKKLIFYHVIPTPTKPMNGLMKNIMTEKVDQHYQDWLFAEEGLTLELPPNSDEIVMSNFDA